MIKDSSSAAGTCVRKLPRCLSGNNNTQYPSFGCSKATGLATRSCALLHAATWLYSHASFAIARFDAPRLVRRRSLPMCSKNLFDIVQPFVLISPPPHDVINLDLAVQAGQQLRHHTLEVDRLVQNTLG